MFSDIRSAPQFGEMKASFTGEIRTAHPLCTLCSQPDDTGADYSCKYPG